MPQSELNHILKSEIPALEKKKLLLSQIGLLRINLFAEYSEKIGVSEGNNQLDKAAEVMNDYAVNIAIPFIPSKKQPSLINRFTRLISRERLLEPFEYIQKWKTEYQSWFERKQKSIFPDIHEREQLERFNRLRETFHTLYSLSFSDDNFPPPPTIIFYNPTRIEI